MRNYVSIHCKFQEQERIGQINKELNMLFTSYQSLANEERMPNIDVGRIVALVNLVHSNWWLLQITNEKLEDWKLSLFSKVCL